MPSQRFHPSLLRPGTLAAALATALLFMGLTLSTAPGAAAHDQIIATSPTSGERLADAPESLVLTFSGSLMSLGTDVLVLDSQEKDWADGEPSLDGEVLTQRLKTAMPDGEYSVRWRVVSSDGHPINGAYTFLVGDSAATGAAGAAPSTPPAGVGGMTETAAGTPKGTAAATDSAAAGTAPSTGAADTGSSAQAKSSEKVGPFGAVMAAIGAFGGVGVYVAYVLIQSRRRNAKEKREAAGNPS